jgi:murein DD-endopeptidase MepM/ murein hydrolase activator NlpD
MTPPEGSGGGANGIAVDFDQPGLWVWNGDESNAENLAKLLARHGFQYIAIKAHDGVKPFRRNDGQIVKYAAAARAHGLAFGLWGYLKANDAAGEARFAAELVHKHHASFYFADVEGEYETATGHVSREFARTFRREMPMLPAAVSSFGRIDLHPDIDWQTWRDHGFEFHPQAYETDNHLLTPARCVEAARRIWPLSMIRPTLGAYKGAGARPSPKRLAQSLREVNTKGFNVWRNGTTTRADIRALAKHETTPSPVVLSATKAHRPLKVLPVFMHGPDIRALQRAINKVLKPLHLGQIDDDKDYGPLTEAAAFEAAYYLGVSNKREGKVLSVYVQRRIRHPELRNQTQIDRAKKRQKLLGDNGVVPPLSTPPGSHSEFSLQDAEGAPANNGRRYHAAKDWFAAGGSRVSAPVAGVVVEAKPSRGNSGQVFGGVVKIQAAGDKKVWVFRHVDPQVRLHEPVTPGERIAKVTKWRDGPSHAHIEIWKKFNVGYDYENMIDPMRYFS